MAEPVGVSDIWHVIRNTRHVTPDMQYMKPVISHLTQHTCHLTHDTCSRKRGGGGYCDILTGDTRHLTSDKSQVTSHK